MTEFNTKNLMVNGKRSYRIEFYTDNKDYYEMVQECCRDCIDGSNNKIIELRKKVKEEVLGELAKGEEVEEVVAVGHNAGGLTRGGVISHG